MTEMRPGERCLGGDRGLQMTNMRMSASSLNACLGLYLSPCNFLPVHLPICLLLCNFVPLSVCQSVCSLQSNGLLTLNVISFLTTLSLFSLRFQQSINNHIVKSKQNIITALTETEGRPYFNHLIAWTTFLKAMVGLL